MLGWEFPPFMAGGLGVHCLALTKELARAGVDIDFYMPHMKTLEGGERVADHHDHARIVEIEADPDVGPYEGSGRSSREPRDYDAKFDEAVELYNQRLVEAFDSPDADVLHCHDWITVPAALELRARTGIPLVFTVHSTEVDRSGGRTPQGWIADIERAGMHTADRVIAVSGYTKELIERVYDAPPERVVPIHNGIDTAQFEDAGTRDYEDRRGTVLFLSRLVPQKGPLHFLEAARRVLEVHPDARFVVAGKGPMMTECIDYTIEHGIAGNVHFAGFVPDHSLAEVYGKSAVYVLPSISEPFGISILEAMATGLPTIVTKTTGAGEALDHVLKVDFWDTEEMADMMIGLLSSTALREEMGRRGGREVHKFAWEDCGRDTLALYQDLLAQRETIEVPTP